MYYAIPTAGAGAAANPTLQLESQLARLGMPYGAGPTGPSALVPNVAVGGRGPAGAPGTPGMVPDTGLGWNLGTGQLALAGLGTIGNLWTAFGAQNLARKQFDFTRGVTETNLANQIKSYNTALADRARARAATENRPQAEADAYVAANRLSR